VLRIRKEDLPINTKILVLGNNYFTHSAKLKGDQVELQTSFRSNEKYARRLWFAFEPLWWVMHFLDWAILDRELFPSLNMIIRNKIVSMSFPTFSTGKVVIPMALGAEVKPVGHIRKVFSSLVGKVYSPRFSAFLAICGKSLSSAYSVVKSAVANIVALPFKILFPKGKTIVSSLVSKLWAYLPSVPRWLSRGIFVAFHSLRHSSLNFVALAKELASPFVIALARAKSFIRFAWLRGVFLFTCFADELYHRLLVVLSIPLSFQFESLPTKYSTPGATVSGFAYRIIAYPGETLTNIRAGAGTGNTYDSGGADCQCLIEATTTTNQFDFLGRPIVTFDASALGSSATLTAGNLGMYGNTAVFSGLGAFEVDIVSSTPASDTALANGDYANLGSTPFASIASTSLVNGGYNSFSLNASGLANISKTGISKFGMRLNWDTDDSFGGTWSSGQISGQYYMDGGYSGTTRDPKIDITYTLPATSYMNLLTLGVG